MDPRIPRRKTVGALFWNTACQICAAQIADFAKASAATGVRLLAVKSAIADAAVAAFIEKHSVARRWSKVRRHDAAAYRADTFPSVALIDAHGRIVHIRWARWRDPARR